MRAGVVADCVGAGSRMGSCSLHPVINDAVSIARATSPETVYLLFIEIIIVKFLLLNSDGRGLLVDLHGLIATLGGLALLQEVVVVAGGIGDD